MQFDCPPFPPGPLKDSFGRPLNDPRRNLIYGWQITSLFGGRPNPFTGVPSYHGGMDLGMPLGTPFIQCIPGKAFQSWDPGGGGNWTTVYLPNANARVGYGHAQRFEPGVNGTSGQPGRVIAYCDSTGSSTGNHLHFGLDDEDPDTAYDDPFDPLYEVCYRFAGGGGLPPVITPPPPTQGGLSMSDITLIDGKLNRIIEKVDPMSAKIIDTLGSFENDTRLILLNGQKVISADSDEKIIEAVRKGTFDSRDFAFCYAGKPAVYQWVDTPSGRLRQWIGVYKKSATTKTMNDVDGPGSQALLASLVKTKLNPFIVVFDEVGIEDVHNSFAPICGTVPPTA